MSLYTLFMLSWLKVPCFSLVPPGNRRNSSSGFLAAPTQVNSRSTFRRYMASGYWQRRKLSHKKNSSIMLVALARNSSEYSFKQLLLYTWCTVFWDEGAIRHRCHGNCGVLCDTVPVCFCTWSRSIRDRSLRIILKFVLLFWHRPCQFPQVPSVLLLSDYTVSQPRRLLSS